MNVCPGFAQAPEEYRGGEQWLPVVSGRKAKTGIRPGGRLVNVHLSSYLFYF